MPLLVRILEDAGYDDTASKLADEMRLQTTTEAPLTVEDHDAILAALSNNCPAGLDRLRRELLQEQLRRRRAGL